VLPAEATAALRRMPAVSMSLYFCSIFNISISALHCDDVSFLFLTYPI
jgi:hypothetical protein